MGTFSQVYQVGTGSVCRHGSMLGCCCRSAWASSFCSVSSSIRYPALQVPASCHFCNSPARTFHIKHGEARGWGVSSRSQVWRPWAVFFGMVAGVSRDSSGSVAPKYPRIIYASGSRLGCHRQQARTNLSRGIGRVQGLLHAFGRGFLLSQVMSQ